MGKHDRTRCDFRGDVQPQFPGLAAVREKKIPFNEPRLLLGIDQRVERQQVALPICKQRINVARWLGRDPSCSGDAG
jgi:hypothetical protein